MRQIERQPINEIVTVRMTADLIDWIDESASNMTLSRSAWFRRAALEMLRREKSDTRETAERETGDNPTQPLNCRDEPPAHCRQGLFRTT